ncbi:Rhamnosyltransferase [Candidatus Accumulibacter aalborgensis]|uniref:Rhamnosyltransferase n=2 Tax=Candidatus Accumulibacter aalborgensis TaxID=1860102 RepID=A0A1A8XUE8_9PROT|nr:Rhamnosyltransferase [Candidatus Accumulibacter aalborgensis]
MSVSSEDSPMSSHTHAVTPMPGESEYCPDVVAVVVTYDPTPDILLPVLEAAARQVSAIIVVDNASKQSPHDRIAMVSRNLGAEVEVLIQTNNRGLGFGYNLGIERAQLRAAAFVLLLDQDSELEFGAVARLRAAHIELAQQGLMAAAVGPRYRDAGDGSLSEFVRVGGCRFKRIPCEAGRRTVNTDFLISSGSLMPMAALEAVGMMDEGLFIDHIDTEWCFRARSLGFGVFGVCDAVMRHSLGERRMAIWFLRWRKVPVHPSFRYYYIFRNSILLRHRPYMPIKWRHADLSRLFQMVFFFGLLVPNRLANMRMMWRGLRDGLKGVTGKL